ncbi:sigma factor-like helix-turn-helix DNA-binding protein [Mucilaginibacter psychrotolerans]|uniref:Sigma-70 family RNA polymerase sigma factor n=1 Tax=Mucilaginibacter psychrotolerans TaxID=1524096 RepID=A0A4Y8S488_9SPHI|nr:sigma-70 family RNA polymerase sigma factor [Mucilaginibacter psychrotolerans]TFF33445.1 sigma-70 family RNA polymerase sigma factor [Mucilaginibacter psychrotolerans]
MEQNLINNGSALPGGVQTRQDLYNSYGGMLLGYLFEATKSKPIAEQYLVDIFNGLQFTDIQAMTKPGINTFCQLQAIARKKLASLSDAVDECAGPAAESKALAEQSNKFTDLMEPEQRRVFCGIHYHGKSTGTLAAELNKTEEAIRRILKESFNVIRNQRNDTAAVYR